MLIRARLCEYAQCHKTAIGSRNLLRHQLNTPISLKDYHLDGFVPNGNEIETIAALVHVR